ncbi:helicase-exonuclease AddAB subunit AddA [Candidatus Epulonipiscium fishelsonii]|uniref:Helicase-exonuclease AddAB subunit AddA n=1 Tax=Candidatus Epulonipiscium fishelsonii TaxID=77094 RepID=A0ACC8XCC3_9FIRM|nr:helicase-exonuclease AddAB subunit AddA [Epulopiscium sp. SCG-B11WGA-EpuloA1]ONI41346.1 helicase-exonuclease AddAB subunit AddA [Epulopiscium sp. SCG-B05WGA-EpuloA1]
MKWTKAQQTAIELRDKNILVSAAAGSGKTAVLAERIFRRIKDEFINVDRFLVVTFTKSAADEMKERVFNKISAEIEQFQQADLMNDNDLNLLKHLEYQIEILPQASISTIHSFCKKIITSYFSKINIDPNVKIGSEAEVAALELDIAEKVLEEQFDKENNNEVFYQVIDTFTNLRGLDNLIAIILKIDKFSKSTVFPTLWLNQKVDMLKELKDITKSIWATTMLENMKSEISDIISLYDNIIRLCKEPNGPYLHLDLIVDEQQQLKSLNVSNLQTLATSINAVKFQRLTNKRQDCNADINAQVKDYRATAKELVIKIKDTLVTFLDKDFIDQSILSNKVIEEVVRIVKLYNKEFSIAKRDRGIVDYNDLEHYALKLLVGLDENEQLYYTDVAIELSKYYKEVYIDEYQDCNNVQEIILGSIAKASEHGATQFMVGDVKQSIYKFRLANPNIFIKKYQTWAKATSTDIKEKNVCVDLSQNFRSRENIVNAINDIFSQIMSPKLGGITYDDDAKLKVGNLYNETEVDPSFVSDKVEMHLIQTNLLEEQEQQANVTSEYISSHLEAEMVATIIDKILKGEGNPKKIFDTDLKEYRDVQPKDIAILLRAKASSTYFEEALVQRDIEAHIEIDSPFLEANEIKFMLSMLQIIDNPLQDIPLLAVLRSPIVGASLDDLVYIKNTAPQEHFYTCLQQYLLDTAHVEEGTIVSIRWFYDLIHSFRKLNTATTLEDLISRLYTESGYYRYVGMLKDGKKRQANLRLLKIHATKYEERVESGLFNFLQYLKKVDKVGDKLEQAKVSTSENVVRILTIHKSKGLEFPIVFVCETHKGFSSKDLQGELLLHHELGIGAKYLEDNFKYETLPYSAIKQAIKQESLSEEMRILYVALTRAREKLFITGSISSYNKVLQKWLNYGNRNEEQILLNGLKTNSSELNWIGKSIVSLKNVISIVQNNNVNFEFNGKSTWDIKIWNEKEVQLKQDEDRAKNELDTLLNQNNTIDYSGHRDQIYSRLDFFYKYNDIINLPNTISISDLKEIKQGQSNFEQVRPEPRFIKKDIPIKGVAKGTLIHEVFERVDYLKYQSRNALQDEINRLINLNKLSPEVKNIINYKRLEAFAQSDVINRMRKAEISFKEKSFVYLLDAQIIDQKYQSEKIVLHGVIDACFIENGNITLIDYKSDYINQQILEEEISRIKKTYQLQLDLYALSLSDILNLPVQEKLIYLYSINKWVTME